MYPGQTLSAAIVELYLLRIKGGRVVCGKPSAILIM